jgi:hypothetical protein
MRIVTIIIIITDIFTLHFKLCSGIGVDGRDMNLRFKLSVLRSDLPRTVIKPVDTRGTEARA